MSLNHQEGKQWHSHRSLVIRIVVVSVLMFGFGYALVPLYSVFCKVTGLNGKTGGPSEAAKLAEIDKSREVTIRFVTTNNAQLPWKFYPLTQTLVLHPGENHLVRFYVENTTDKAMTVQAVPSVSPGLAAGYLRKTECFCFTQQMLEAGKSKKMPVLFHIDTSLPKDIHSIVLSYTLFDAEQFKRAVPLEGAGKIAS